MKMKKIICFLLLVCLFPISVFAKDTKNDVVKIINQIENTVVDDDVKIISTNVDEKVITLQIDRNGLTYYQIPYYWDENKLYFGSGVITIQNNEVTLKNNEESFYLYSILENLSNSPYDVENYYDDERIIQKVHTSFEKKIPYRYIDISETFGFILQAMNENTYSVWYTYNLESNYTINKDNQEETSKQVEVDQPSRRGFVILVTIMLGCVIFLAIYSIVDSEKRRRRDERFKKTR